MAKSSAKFLLIFAIAVLLFGAGYMALAHSAWAIAGCFAAGAVLLSFCGQLPSKK